ncbi:hypothetical protein D3C74_338890 [compost metagenome]
MTIHKGQRHALFALSQLAACEYIKYLHGLKQFTCSFSNRCEQRSGLNCRINNNGDVPLHCRETRQVTIFNCVACITIHWLKLQFCYKGIIQILFTLQYWMKLT